MDPGQTRQIIGTTCQLEEGDIHYMIINIRTNGYSIAREEVHYRYASRPTSFIRNLFLSNKLHCPRKEEEQ